MRTKRYAFPSFFACLCLLATGASAKETSWSTLEGFGNIGIQSNSAGGKSYAGGVRWAPRVGLAPLFDAKPFIGLQTLKGTDKIVYPIAEYGGMGQFLHLDPIVIDFGLGLATSFRKGTPTRFQMAAGVEYKLSKPFFGLIDRLVADARYYFESSDLYIINYGASISF